MKVNLSGFFSLYCAKRIGSDMKFCNKLISNPGLKAGVQDKNISVGFGPKIKECQDGFADIKKCRTKKNPRIK
ncbi:MAG: hypothetical protein PHY20_12970 [Bacteroidales bacterium]|nr:hypothetical protein [Bacteroidales bacterium]